MTNKKGTKRSLLMSALAMLLCVSMLIGSTFAWFTDSVTSAGNIIKSGTLDVEMYWADGTKAVPTADADWENAADGAIFKYDLWEPGYTEVRHIKIENKGSLALKYQLNILPNGEVTDLADVIDVYYLDPAAQLNDRASIDAQYRLGTLTEVLAGMADTASGELLAGKSDTVTIALKMQESATNEYQDKYIGSSFSIQLLATQLTYEEDSFDDLYDEDATLGTYIELNAGADLLAAMASAQADMPLTIKLNGNVEWPTEGHHGENDVTPASSILIDGNGYTITATGAGVTPLGDNNAPMTLKNVKIVDNSVSYSEGSWEFTYLEMGGSSLTCYNVTFADEIQIGTNATFTNCSFESNEESVYAVWVEDGSAAFTNCTFTGYRGLKAHEEYGSEISAVIVKDCVFSNLSKKPGIALGRICMNGDTYKTGSTTYTNTTDTTVSITGSTFINCQAGDQSLYIYETDTDVAKFNFKEENNTVLNNATIVSTKDDLLALSAKALTSNNGVAEEATIVIGADIDMQGADFSAIIAQRGDKLTVVGNGHKISNVKVVSGANDNTTGQASMFYTYPNSTLTVSNLVLENITVTAEANGTGYAAAVVAYAEGNVVLNNVDVVNATVTGVKSSGVLIGHLSGSLEATDCDLSGTVTLADFAEEANGHYAGKYIGTLAGAAELNKCTVNATVSGNLNAANSGDVYGRATAAGSIKIDGAAYVAPKTVTYDAAAMGGLYEYLPTLNSGDTVILPAGTYTTSGTLLVPHGVTIKGAEGAEVIFHQNSAAQDDLFNCEGDVYFENITFESNRKGYAITYKNQDHTIDGDITVINCKFKGLAAEKNYGIYKNLNGNLTVKDCTFDTYNNAICGVNNGNGSTTVITGCTFTNINGEAIGYVTSSVPADFEAEVIANNTGLTADNVIGW